MFNAADQLETDLVGFSSHAGARPLCAPYQGRIFSRTGNTPGYDKLSDTSYGQAAGLLGVNCGHNMYPYTPDMTWPYKPTPDAAENAKQYADSQTQRKIERNIRDAKRKAQMNTAAAAKSTDKDEKAAYQRKADHYKQRVKEQQQKMREFIEDTGRTRRSDREQIYG
jgi:hypothetical protein